MPIMTPKTLVCTATLPRAVQDKLDINTTQVCLKVDSEVDNFQREVLRLDVDKYRGKVLKKTKGGTEYNEDGSKLPRERVAHLLLSECLAGTKNVLYGAYVKARIVTPFNRDDPDPQWTPYELDSQDELAVVIFVSGKNGMAQVMGQWSAAEWKDVQDSDPEMKKFILKNYHLNPVAATGDDCGCTTTTLRE